MAVGPWIANDIANSGSATGNEALTRANKFLEGVGSGSRSASATDARAAWTAPDLHGDNSEYIAFTIPVSEVPAFERAISTAWGPPVGIREMPAAGGEPDWFRERLDDPVFYEQGTITVGISRKTGRVLLRHWAS